jgi:hypothetical protein
MRNIYNKIFILGGIMLKKNFCLILLLVAFLASPLTEPLLADHGFVRGKCLRSQIDYWYVGYLGTTDEEGRMLIWEGNISGDITGTMKWWFGPSPAESPPYVGGSVIYYAGRWEIWDVTGTELLLAGESAGKTVTPTGEDCMWDGHGVVTEASKWFNPLKGCHIYETGPVIFNGPPYGTGIFVIY